MKQFKFDELMKMLSLIERQPKPRNIGMNIVKDQGLTLKMVEQLLAYSEFIDAVEIGPASLFLGGVDTTKHLKERVSMYNSCGITPFLSSLIFESFYLNGELEDYFEVCRISFINTYLMSGEFSKMSHQEKLKEIEKFSELGNVHSCIGYSSILPPYKWIEMMKSELGAGAKYVHALAGRNGYSGLYRENGEIRTGLVEEILTKVPPEKIIWEASEEYQQSYFIKLLGDKCNLSGVARGEELMNLETMRIGFHPSTLSTKSAEEKEEKAA